MLRRKVPGRPHHPAVPLFPVGGVRPGSSARREHVEAAEADIAARARAASASLIHRGVDETVDIFDVIQNPTASVNLVSFTVPAGLVGKFDKFAVVFSDPLIPQTSAVKWRITIDGNEAPNIRSNWGTWSNLFGICGDLHDPMDVTPLWLQANQVIAIGLVLAVAVAFDDAVLIAGRISGKLYKPASPALLSSGGGE